MSALRNGGRQDPRVVLLLGLVLLLCLGAVAGSWAWAHRKPRSRAPQDYASRSAELAQEADVLMQSIDKRLHREEPPLDLARFQAQRTQAVAVAVAVAAPHAVKTDITFHLRGIAWSPTRPVAFVDDRTLEKGDAIDGFTVQDIGKASVTFRDPLGREKVLNLNGE